MAFHRPIAAVLGSVLLPLSLIACGGSGGGGTITPTGAHNHYVANSILIPSNNTEAREYGLDLNGDGTVDNQLGMVLGTLASMGFTIQATVDKAVSQGSIILLLDFQTTDFTNAGAAGIQALLGTNPVPPACNGSADTTCGHHLTGTGMFTVDPNSPTNAALAGKVVNGEFDGGPGDLSLQIALGGTNPISLSLIGAKAKASGITATAIGTSTSGGLIFGGALTQDDLNNKVLPAIQAQLVPIIARDCTMLNMPNGNPPCGCADGSTGKTLIGLFDTNPKDCMVTVMEIQNNTLIQSLLAPDVTIDGQMALSIGIKATAVGATFTYP